MGASGAEIQDLCTSIFDTYMYDSDDNLLFSIDFEDHETEQIDVECIEQVKERLLSETEWSLVTGLCLSPQSTELPELKEFDIEKVLHPSQLLEGADRNGELSVDSFTGNLFGEELQDLCFTQPLVRGNDLTETEVTEGSSKRGKTSHTSSSYSRTKEQKSGVKETQSLTVKDKIRKKNISKNSIRSNKKATEATMRNSRKESKKSAKKNKLDRKKSSKTKCFDIENKDEKKCLETKCTEPTSSLSIPTVPLQWCECGSIMNLIDQTDFNMDNYLNHMSIQSGNLFDLLTLNE